MTSYKLPDNIQSAIADLAYALAHAQDTAQPDHDPAVVTAYNELTERVRQECDIDWLQAPLTEREEKSVKAARKLKERKDLVLGINEEDDLEKQDSLSQFQD
jgi:hypothetical protein